MKKIEKLKLIEGDFTYEEAKEILMNIFSAKIHYHEMKNYSSQERFGKDDETAKNRIPQLENEIEKVKNLVKEAATNKNKLIITSEINVTQSNQ